MGREVTGSNRIKWFGHIKRISERRLKKKLPRDGSAEQRFEKEKDLMGRSDAGANVGR